MPAATSQLDILTLVVAIVGVVLAAVSLAWQAAVFLLSGSRVRVALRRGAIRRSPSGTVRMSGPLQPTASDYEAMRSQGFADEVLIVEVRNLGRMAVSVEDVSAATTDGWGFARLADPENPKLPHRLEPHSMEAWHVELAPLQSLVNLDGKQRQAWMTVELGTGKSLRTREATVIVPSVGAGEAEF